MREIKCRGKRIDDGVWFYGYYVKWETRQCCVLGDDNLKDDEIVHLIVRDGFADWNMPRSLEFTKVDKETVGQSTELKDENGVEIFEGDIFRDLKRYDYTVRFEDGAFRIYEGNEFTFTQDDANFGFVVGNIHDEE